ncbi:cytochrome P450 [Nocardiopsis alborubida]|uniref:Cytochrome P450 n=1 Tax=Nocardiopsis alborubida TaxID=146802 RepID=A0A7X6MC19_9ACTN|nr:cytochrome P450 [Nocardiopsis alborubida]NKY97198.1 cytochrome P450 [Nocardiopsis alborubida]
MTVPDLSGALDLADPDFRQNPYPHYERLRDESGLFWHEGYLAYVVPRYEDVARVLKSSRWHVRPGSGFLDRQLAANETVNQLMQGFYYFLDDPHHRRLRSVVSTTFTPRIVSSFRGRIQQIVDGLLDSSLGERGEAEFMNDVSYPLTIRVVTEILGFDAEEDQKFLYDRALALAGLLEWDAPVERVTEGGESMMEISNRFVDLLESRRQEPRDDLISSLIAARAEGRTSDDFEVIFMCVLLVTVGYETTMNYLGNSVYSLLTHPDQFERLVRDPGMLGSGPALDELLRYEAPVQVTSRVAMDDVDVAGTRIRAGEQVVVMLGGSNRDPGVFTDPDRLDLGRANANRHMTFAHGPHFCLGAALAKTEAEILLSTLARRYPGVRLAPDHRWRDTAILRSLSHLPLRLEK